MWKWIFSIVIISSFISYVEKDNINCSEVILASSNPVEQRSQEYYKYLSTTVRIWSNETYGSGTIIYFDSKYAYISSCGHLWKKNKTSAELKKNPSSCQITVWYHNEKKLSSPKNYKAEILFTSNSYGNDCSLLRFIPDWKPNYYPIAPLDYKIKNGMKLHSIGCDGTREVAHYAVEAVGFNEGGDLVTHKNSPRPGRSGGGLISDDDYYVGICWGTNNSQGLGVGYFTPLKIIHKKYKENGYEWLLNIFIARKIPIIDENNNRISVDENYIPLPGTK